MVVLEDVPLVDHEVAPPRAVGQHAGDVGRLGHLVRRHHHVVLVALRERGDEALALLVRVRVRVR